MTGTQVDVGIVFIMIARPPRSTLFPSTPLFRSAISKRTRGMAWQIVRLATQTALQQFDNEDDTSYFARRSSGEFQLNLLESMILDTDSVRVGLKYATDDEPIRLRVEIDARNRSNLAKHFGNMSRGDKRLASLRDRPSADRKSTRLNSSHVVISYAVFCLKKKTKKHTTSQHVSRTTDTRAV